MEKKQKTKNNNKKHSFYICGQNIHYTAVSLSAVMLCLIFLLYYITNILE